MEKILVSLYCSSAAALLFTITLIILTLHNYSRTGPGIQKEIEKKFGYYVVFALTRLATWLFVIFFLTSLPGSIAAYSLSKLTTLIEFNFITGLFSLLHPNPDHQAPHGAIMPLCK
ncbi:hypothetical protein [Methylomonas sp. YC3]